MDYYRQLTTEDLFSILALQQLCFKQSLLETKETYLNKINMFPEGCIGCFFDDGLHQDLIGQLFFHPWDKNIHIQINSTISVLPESCNCLYLQEIAIHPNFRAKGLFRIFMDMCMSWGKILGYNTYRAISVQGSLPLLKRRGFQVVGEIDYGIDKGYLVEFNDVDLPNRLTNLSSGSLG